MATIEIDFEVQKALWAKRETESMTFNDVLRKLLGLPSKEENAEPVSLVQEGRQWVVKGTPFPLGTEFRATYKGKSYFGKVDDGGLVVDGKRFKSPSAAAVAITGNSVNGWTFWECRLPGKDSWKMIKYLRNFG